MIPISSKDFEVDNAEHFPGLPNPDKKRSPAPVADLHDARVETESVVKTNQSTDQNTVHGLFHMVPLEIREMIYYHVMESSFCGINLCGPMSLSGPENCPNFLPDICRTSREIFNEATPVFLRNCTFKLYGWSSVNRLQRFLDTFDCDNGYKSIRALEVNSNHWTIGPAATNPFIKLFKSCPGMRHIQLIVFLSDIAHGSAVTGVGTSFEAKFLASVLALYPLHMLLDCKSLRNVTLSCVNDFPPNYSGGPPRSSGPALELQEIAHWLRNEFSRKKRQVAVDFIWHTEHSIRVLANR